MERTFLLMLEFDGTEFCGWQRQAEGRSVQQVIEAAVTRLAGSPRVVQGAGRTDAGVHALALPANVTLPSRWTPPDLLKALNAVLPRDVAVKQVCAVLPDFNARRAAIQRSYRYDIMETGSGRSPHLRTVWALGRRLDLPAMNRATASLLGEHNFRAFSLSGDPRPHYRCTIHRATWTRLDAGLLRFEVTADRFLHRMIRLLVGTLVEIGLGRRSPEEISHLLTLNHNRETSSPAPASGLTFLAAEYPAHFFLGECATW